MTPFVLTNIACLALLTLAEAFCPAPLVLSLRNNAQRSEQGYSGPSMVWMNKSPKLMKDDPIPQKIGRSGSPTRDRSESPLMTNILHNMVEEFGEIDTKMGHMQNDLDTAKSILAEISSRKFSSLSEGKPLKHFSSVQTRVGKAESLLQWQRQQIKKLKEHMLEVPVDDLQSLSDAKRSHAEVAWKRGRDTEIEKVEEDSKEIDFEIQQLLMWASYFKHGGDQPWP